MSTIHVTAKRDFLESLTAARPLAAIAELVWNGFDAQSDQIQVHLDINTMGGIQSIRVRDVGVGIDRSLVESMFGSLGDSWKKNKGRLSGRALHGKNGKGRFKAFALGTHIEWKTTCKLDNKLLSYRITGNSQSLDDFNITDPVEIPTGATGTEVVISNIRHEFRSLLDDSAPQEIAKIFAAFLTEYPGLTLEYDGNVIDPKNVQRQHNNYHLGDVEIGNGKKTPVALTIIEWNIKTDRVLNLCDANGITLHEAQGGLQIHAPGFNFTAYVKSDHLRELDKLDQLALA